MWNVFVEYITRDSIHLTLFICLVALSVIGFCEIIFQIWNCFHKAKIANDFMHHIDIIAAHVHKRLEKEKTRMNQLMEQSTIREEIDIDFVNQLMIDIRKKQFEL